MSPFLRGGKAGRKGGVWGGGLWDGGGRDGPPAGQQGVGQPGSRSRRGGAGMFWLELPIRFH